MNPHIRKVYIDVLKRRWIVKNYVISQVKHEVIRFAAKTEPRWPAYMSNVVD